METEFVSTKRPASDVTPENQIREPSLDLPGSVITDETGVLVYCKPCKRWFQNLHSWTDHSKGKKHSLNLREHGESGDGMPPIEIPSNYLERAKKALKRKGSSSKKRKLNDDDESNCLELALVDHPVEKTTSTDSTGLITYCKVCEKWLGDYWAWKTHRSGDAHKSKLLQNDGVQVESSQPRRIPASLRRIIAKTKEKCNLCGTWHNITKWKDHCEGVLHGVHAELFLASSGPKDDYFRCSECFIDLPMYRWTNHRASQGHAIQSGEVALHATRSGQYRWAFVKNTIFCQCCKFSVKDNEFNAHVMSEDHQNLVEKFRKKWYSPSTVRPCYLCSEFVENQSWKHHLESDNHEARAIFYPPPLPPPLHRRCGPCTIDIPFIEWKYHIASDEHFVNSAMVPQLVRCLPCNTEITLEKWLRHDRMLPIRDATCSESSRCVAAKMCFSCVLCPNPPFCSSDLFATHLRSSEHHKNLQRLGGCELEIRNCDECDLALLPAHWEFHKNHSHRTVITADDRGACHLCGVIAPFTEIGDHFRSEEHELIVAGKLNVCQECGPVKLSHWETPYLVPAGIEHIKACGDPKFVDDSELDSEEDCLTDWLTSESEDDTSQKISDFTSVPIHSSCGVYDESGLFVYCRVCKHWMWAHAYGGHIRKKKHWLEFDLQTQQGGIVNSPVPKLDEDLSKGVLSNCFYCGPHSVWSCSEHRHSKKHLSKVRKYLQDNPDIDITPNCSCRDDAWGSYKKAIRAIETSIKKSIECCLCHVVLKQSEWSAHYSSSSHRARRVTFINHQPQTLFPVRNCYVCCEQIPCFEWSSHLSSINHILRATTQPPPSPPPLLRRCGVCNFESSLEKWDTHVSSNEHVIRTVSQPQTVRCNACRTNIALNSWTKYTKLLPLKGWMCSETTRCLGGTINFVCIVCCLGVPQSGKQSQHTTSAEFHDIQSFAKHLSDSSHRENLKRLQEKGLQVRQCDECNLSLLPAHLEFHRIYEHESTVSMSDNVVCHACNFVGSGMDMNHHIISKRHLESVAKLPDKPQLQLQQWCHQCEIFAEKAHWESPYLAPDGLRKGDVILDAFGTRKLYFELKHLMDLEKKMKKLPEIVQVVESDGDGGDCDDGNDEDFDVLSMDISEEDWEGFEQQSVEGNMNDEKLNAESEDKAVSVLKVKRNKNPKGTNNVKSESKVVEREDKANDELSAGENGKDNSMAGCATQKTYLKSQVIGNEMEIDDSVLKVEPIEIQKESNAMELQGEAEESGISCDQRKVEELNGEGDTLKKVKQEPL